MKISKAGIERFLSKPDSAVRAVLFYGPDSGLVRERARRVLTAIVGADADPFRLAELTGAAVRDEPARLYEEAGAMSLTGGRRAIRVRDVTDPAAAILEAFLLEDGGDTMIVAEGGDLPARSSLRRLFENHAVAACIPCYGDDDRALSDVVRETLGTHDVAVSRDALAYLLGHLGSDRMISRSELEKLALYVGDGNTADLGDVLSCVGDNSTMAVDDVVDAAASGDMAGLTRRLDRAFIEGVNAIAILRAAIRHLQRLEYAAVKVENGKSAEEAIKGLRPPVFFRRADAFRLQLSRISAAQAANRLADLLDAEISCKSTGAPAQEICSRAMMRVALGSARGRA